MSTKNYGKTRFSANDTALVLIDQQSGIMHLVHDYSPAEFRNNVIGLAKLGKVYKLSTVLTRALAKVQTARLSQGWYACSLMCR
jgi:hypothetical protein